jgi:hypothetical protein
MDHSEVIRFKEELQQILIRLKEENDALLKLIKEIKSQGNFPLSTPEQNKPKTIKQ